MSVPSLTGGEMKRDWIREEHEREHFYGNVVRELK
jgi:hypothetical protein